ncbi:MAG: hypothetical protein AB1403_13755 [Candidatus Riflebacteria bacterium]
MATQPLNTNPFLQQVLFQNLSSANVQPGQVKSSAQLISAAFSAKASVATISSSGAKINRISLAVRESGSAEAYQGFQAAVSRAGASSDPLQLIRLSNSADFMAGTNAETLNQAFASIGRNLSAGGNSLLDGFNSAFSSTVEKAGTAGLAQFNRSVQAIENAGYSGSSISASDNLQKFFTAAKQINAGSEDSAQAVSGLSQMAGKIEAAGSGDSISAVFDEFFNAESTG